MSDEGSTRLDDPDLGIKPELVAQLQTQGITTLEGFFRAYPQEDAMTHALDVDRHDTDSYRIGDLPLCPTFDPYTGLCESGEKRTHLRDGVAVVGRLGFVLLPGCPPFVYHGPALSARRLARNHILVEIGGKFFLGPAFDPARWYRAEGREMPKESTP